jgi:hypothetical protein
VSKLIVILNKYNEIKYSYRTVVHHPQRLQTVLELYSQDLKGLILFIDTNNLDFYSGLAKGNLEILFIYLIYYTDIFLLQSFLIFVKVAQNSILILYKIN